MSAKADKTGSCSFCGQTKIIQVPEEWEQGQINEAVTCECECEQAQAYAKAKERKDKAKNKYIKAWFIVRRMKVFMM